VDELAPVCSYELFRQYIDPGSAKAHFLLAQHCVLTGLIEQAKAELQRCRELDASYAEQVEKALAALSGEAVEDSPVNPEEFIAKQRLNGKKANEKLGTNVKTTETAHFIIHSDFTSATDMAQIRKWCETLYERHCATLDVKPGDRLWNGKGEIFLFLSRGDFVRFARTIDNFPEAKLSGGYFWSKGRNCHIVIPRTDLRADRAGQKDTFLLTLLHEGSHAFLQLHGNVVEINPWLHEGFAQYFELALPKGGAAEREKHVRLVKRITSKPGFTRFKELRALERLLGDDYEGYALSWSIVDYMITSDKTHKQFARFIQLIKDGKEEGEAMKEAFNQTPDELEQSWLRYIRSLR